MGWAHGIDVNGEDIGYAIPDVCHFEDCTAEIDRGLAHHCGGLDSPRLGGDEGCGGFFCGEHFYGNRCGACLDREEAEATTDSNSGGPREMTKGEGT